VGAIAQLGERLLCKQEVVGSIPSGSTSLRSRSETKAAALEPEGRKRAGAASFGSASRKPPTLVHDLEFVPRRSSITRCRLSDIVKRRSIRRCTQ
jgi:hypothetical protein